MKKIIIPTLVIVLIGVGVFAGQLLGVPIPVDTIISDSTSTSAMSEVVEEEEEDPFKASSGIIDDGVTSETPVYYNPSIEELPEVDEEHQGTYIDGDTLDAEVLDKNITAVIEYLKSLGLTDEMADEYDLKHNWLFNTTQDLTTAEHPCMSGLLCWNDISEIMPYDRLAVIIAPADVDRDLTLGLSEYLTLYYRMDGTSHLYEYQEDDGTNYVLKDVPENFLMDIAQADYNQYLVERENW